MTPTPGFEVEGLTQSGDAGLVPPTVVSVSSVGMIQDLGITISCPTFSSKPGWFSSSSPSAVVDVFSG
jgi:hypothetical protein